MRIKLRDAIAVFNGLNYISKFDFSAKTSYKIARNISLLQSECREIEQNRIKVLEKYSEKDENQKPKIINDNYLIPDDMLPLVNKEINELLDEEIELDLRTISIAELDNNRISPQITLMIMPILEHKEGE